ncbi:unnamed protein product, partial [Sphacelaria rigidula]
SHHTQYGQLLCMAGLFIEIAGRVWPWRFICLDPGVKWMRYMRYLLLAPLEERSAEGLLSLDGNKLHPTSFPSMQCTRRVVRLPTTPTPLHPPVSPPATDVAFLDLVR